MLHLVAGLLLAACLAPFCAPSRKKKIIQWWCKKVLGILNIEVKVSGDSPNKSATLFVSNHISWVDVFALMSIVPLIFIGKSDIKNWPLLGFLARHGNVIFIEREKRLEAKRMNPMLRQLLTSGEQLCYFPEGTTTNGTHLLPFKASLLQTAIDTKTSIQAVAIFYPLKNQKPNIAMSYAGDTTIMQSLKNILHQQNPKVALHFFSAINTAQLSLAEQDRRLVCAKIQDEIQTHLYGATSKK
jgi:1-acyl-sn-glycerol-3-phosphate acyltransferase